MKIIATSDWSCFPNDKIKIFTLLGRWFPTHSTTSQPYQLPCWPLHVHWELYVLICLHLSFHSKDDNDTWKRHNTVKKRNTSPGTKSEAFFQTPARLSPLTFSSRFSPQYFQFQRGLISFSSWMPPVAFKIVRPTFLGQDKQMTELFKCWLPLRDEVTFCHSVISSWLAVYQSRWNVRYNVRNHIILCILWSNTDFSVYSSAKTEKVALDRPPMASELIQRFQQTMERGRQIFSWTSHNYTK